MDELCATAVCSTHATSSKWLALMYSLEVSLSVIPALCIVENK